MNLNKENMRKLRELILFTIIILIALWNYKILFDWIGAAFRIILPFILGGGIAFILNIPMSFLEEKIFQNRHLKEKKIAQRLSRPVCLILTLAIVIGVVVLVMFVVIPELTRTILSLGRTIQAFIPEAQRFLEQLFTNNKDIQQWLANLNLDVGRLTDSAMAFFQNSAGNVLNSTMSAIGSIVSGVTTFVIAFVFSCYVLLQKEKLNIQVKKVVYAFFPEKRAEWMFEVGSLASKAFSSFFTGQCVEALILGCMFFIVMSILNMPYTMLVSYFWRVYRMFCGTVPDPDGGSHADDRVCGNVPDPAADRRKSDLPESGGKFCRAPVNLGAGGGDHRRESDGYRGNADLHPHRVSGVYPVPCQCI